MRSYPKIGGFRLRRISALLLLWVCAGRVLAEEPATQTKVPSQGRSTLSAASDAASAAALAAKAAAEAASTAAQAANAAIQAIQTLMPPTPRPSSASPAQEIVDQSSLSQKESDVFRVDALSSPPMEQSLFGLVGSYEVLVEIDQSGDFLRSLSRIQGHATPATLVSAMSLDEALAWSLGFSRDVLIAQYRQEQAVAQSGQARATLLPSVSISAKTGKETSSPSLQTDPVTGLNLDKDTHDRSDKTITFSQPVFDWSSFYSWRRFKLMERARAQNHLGSKGDAYLAAVNAYLNLASTRILADMTAEYEGQISELFSYIEKRAKAGAANPSDVDRVKARVINIHSNKVEQDSAHSAAGIEFIRLVNVVPKSMRLPLSEELGVQDLPASFDQASALALLNNPDIEALREELAAADLDIGSAKGRYLPRLNLEASKNEVAHASGSPGVQKDDRVMLVMNWTPFNSWGDVKFHEEKIARRNELIYRLDDQRRRVLQNLSAQYATLDSIRVRLKQGYLELESVASAARSMSARMLSANQSLLDLLDVYERHYQAKTRLVNLHIQELSSVAQITRLLERDASEGALAGKNKVSLTKPLGQ